METKLKNQELAVCVDCFQYISTGELGLDISIEEAAAIIGSIELNWPEFRFILDSDEYADKFDSDDPCDCCDKLDSGNRFIINAIEVH